MAKSTDEQIVSELQIMNNRMAQMLKALEDLVHLMSRSQISPS